MAKSYRLNTSNRQMNNFEIKRDDDSIFDLDDEISFMVLCSWSFRSIKTQTYYDDHIIHYKNDPFLECLPGLSSASNRYDAARFISHSFVAHF